MDLQNKVGDAAIKKIKEENEENDDRNKNLKKNNKSKNIPKPFNSDDINNKIKSEGIDQENSEEIEEKKSGISKSDTNKLIKDSSFKLYNIFQIILCVIILSIVLVLVLLSGSIAVSGWSMDGDPGTIAKIIIFLFASFFWFLYLPYYYIVVVLMQGIYYTSNIYPLPNWLG